MPDYPRYVTPRSWKGLLTPLTLAERPRKTANWHGLSTHRSALHSWVASLLMYSRLWVASLRITGRVKSLKCLLVCDESTLCISGNHLYWPNNHKLLANKINLMCGIGQECRKRKGRISESKWGQCDERKATELTFILLIGVFFVNHKWNRWEVNDRKNSSHFVHRTFQ